VGESVVIGSCSGTFYVLDRHTGDVRWTYDVHQDSTKQTSFHGDPLILGNRVLIGTDLSCDPTGVGYLYSFDIENRTVQWKDRHSGIPTPVIEWKNLIFFGSVNDRWYAADAGTGKTAWEYQAAGANAECGILRAPVVIEDNLYVLASDGSIHILNTQTGKLLLKIHPPSRPRTALAMYHDQVLFGGENDTIYALKPGGQPEAIARLEGMPTGRMELKGDVLWVFLDSPDHRGRLASVDIRSGKLLWTHTTEHPWSSDKPRLWKDQILAGDCEGHLSSFASDDGRELWSEEFKGCIRSIGTSPDVLYIGVLQGPLYAFTPDK